MLASIEVSMHPIGLDTLAALAVLLGGLVLVTELVVALVELLALLLQGLEVLVLLGELLLEGSKLTRLSGDGELLTLLGVLVGTLVGLDAVLKTHDLHDHDVGAVQDEGEEEGETAEVHVALGVELASLDFETLVTHDTGSSLLSVLSGRHELNLNAVDSVDTVDEENENEDKGDLHPILDLGNDRVLGDEGEKLALDVEWHGDDEHHEEAHLRHQEDEDKSVVERHRGRGVCAIAKNWSVFVERLW